MCLKIGLEPLRLGFQKVLDKPSIHGRENVNDDKGRFFEDYCNWERIKEFKDCIFKSPAAQIIGEATNRLNHTQIFHEHIFIKEARNTQRNTMAPRYAILLCWMEMIQEVFWIPLDEC